MAFLSPLWLLGLLPWGAVCLFMMWGRRKRRNVPFAKLWKHLPHQKRVERRIIPPPVFVLLVLTALLLGVFAAASPVIRWPGASGTKLTIIVDRGLTMSAVTGGATRYQLLSKQLQSELQKTGSPAEVQLRFVPPLAEEPEGRRTDLQGFTGLVDRAAPAATDTADAVRQTAREAGGQGGPVFVITDADLGTPPTVPENRRPVRIAPTSPPADVAITLFAARAASSPQVMVRVRNSSAIRKATLKLTGDGMETPVEKVLDLPPDGRDADVFVDLPRLGQVLSAELIVQDELPANNAAWLVREGAWPTIEPGAAVGELSRLLDLYAKLRPANEGSRRVALRYLADPANESAGVLIPAAGGSTLQTLLPTRVAAHPVTDAVADWLKLGLPVLQGVAPPDGFTPLLWAGDQPIVAVREAPARQVWSAISTDGWSHLPQYVAFWTAAFDWAGQGSDAYVAYSLKDWDRDWQPVAGGPLAPPGRPVDASAVRPGLYVRLDGVRRAFNAPEIARRPPGDSMWIAQVAMSQSNTVGDRVSGWKSAGPWLIATAIVLLLIAAFVWPRSPAAIPTK